MEDFKDKEINMNRRTSLNGVNVELLDEDDKLCDLVVQEIQINLKEPNGELIEKIVSTLGVRKSLQIYETTRMIEENGGLLVQDGSRRRTPGGVFLHSISNDKTIPKAVLKEIFYDSSQETKKKKNEEARERRRLTNSKLRELLIKEGSLSSLPE